MNPEKQKYSDKLAIIATQNIKERDYWLAKLSEPLEKTHFPYDNEYPPGETRKIENQMPQSSKHMNNISFRFSKQLFDKSMKLSGGLDLKLHMILAAGLMVLLEKYTGQKDIMIGSPILKQDTKKEFINKLLIFRNRVEKSMTFKQLLLEVRETIINAADNQNYPMEILIDQLNLPLIGSESPFFDVALLLENLHDISYIQDIYRSITFSFRGTDQELQGDIRYDTRLYRQNTIRGISGHLTCLLDTALEDVNIRLGEIDMLSNEEKNQLLSQFNRPLTSIEPREVQAITLDEALEKQVKTLPDHIALVYSHQQISYRSLNESSHQLAKRLQQKSVGPDTIVALWLPPSIEMMIGELGILKSGGAYLPIALDAPPHRVRFILKDSNTGILLTTGDLIDDSKIGSWEGETVFLNTELRNSPLERGGPKGRGVSNLAALASSSTLTSASTRRVGSANLAYIIYTSGTTGRPKGTAVEHRQVMAYLNAFYREFDVSSTDTVLQLAPYSFDVFIEEVYSLLLKGGKIIIPNDNQIMDIRQLSALILKHRVSIIDCTPLLLNEFNKQDPELLDSVRLFISGGDILKEEYITNLSQIAALYNTYGPTETTVCATYYRYSPIPGQQIPIGKPITGYHVYILDEMGQPQPIGAPGEICISGPGVTRGYLNRPELTHEKFDHDLWDLQDYHDRRYHRSYMSYRSYVLYRTGDRGRWLVDGNIEFLGRIDLQVKIRGYRIETGEIENQLVKMKGIKEAAVIPRQDKEKEKYLCAYVVPEHLEIVEKDYHQWSSQLRQYLLDQLPDYMIPSFFVPLERLPLTPNGKINRKALPEPEIKSSTEYIPHRNPVEERLVHIWQEIFKLEKIGVTDDFFDLGGHSLWGIQIANEIHKYFEIEIQFIQVFQERTIEKLAQYIKKAREEKYVTIKPVEEKEYYPLSSAQRRLYILYQMVPKSIFYNMPSSIPMGKTIDRQRLEQVFKQLIQRHDTLRTSFAMIRQQPVQKIHKNVPFQIRYFDSTAGDEQNLQAIRSFPFDLTISPLLRVGLLKKPGNYILLMDMHHIITDGASLSLLQKEFNRLYSEKQLPRLKLQYKDYSEWQNSRQQKAAIKEQEAYWLKEFSDELPVLNLPVDYPRPLMQSVEGNHVNFTLNARETHILKTIAKENNATLYMSLLAVFNVLFSKLSTQEDFILGTPVVARRHADLQHVIGMMANTLSMRNYPSANKTFDLFLKEVRKRTLKAYENQEYPFEELVEKISINRDTSRNPLFDVMLNVFNPEEIPSQISGIDIQTQPQNQYQHKEASSRFDMAFNATEMGEQIHFFLEYSTRLYKPLTIETLIKYLKNLIGSLPGNTRRKIIEIEYLDLEEKEKILYTSQGVKEPHEKNRTLQKWFENQVEQTPDHVCCSMLSTLNTNDSITYKELNKKSNQLAHLLREKAIGPGSLVGLLLERSLEMIMALLAVLKTGAAYMPIDPAYPRQRILTMFNDSQVPVLLTQGNLWERFSITSLKRMDFKKKNETLIITPPRKPIINFDQLPNRGLVNYEIYHQSIGIAMARHTVSLQATRGCPFNCAYCHKIWPKTHIVRSAESILQEIHRCRDAGVRQFVFIDDIFNLDKKNSSKIFETLIQQNLELQLFFPNGLRGDILTPDFIDLMIEAGTVNLAMALESASPRIQKLIRKNLDLEKFEKNIRYITEKYPWLLLEMELMIGFPTESQQEALTTLEFLKRLKWVHFPNLNILKIYPNTDMYQLAREKGIDEKSIQRSLNLTYNELPETLPYTKGFVREYQTRLMNEYFLSKERLLQVLPLQVKTLTEDELVKKYNSYLPVNIERFQDILDCAGISKEELGPVELLPHDYMAAPGFREKITMHFPAQTPVDNPFKILLLDLSQFFTRQRSQMNMLYDMVEEPLGLMYLLSYLDQTFKGRVLGKIAKSRTDFDSLEELKTLVSDFKPHLIGIRTLSYYKDFFHRTVLSLRQWGIHVPIIAGGPYATSDYKFILQDPNVDVVGLGEGELTLAHLVEKMIDNNNQLPREEILKNINGIAFVTKRDKIQDSPELLLLDKLFLPRLETYPVENPPPAGQPCDPLYVIYTSGSTGTPKGVILENKNLGNLIRYQYNNTNIDFSRVLQFTTISFDVSAQEIFSTLLAGGRLLLIPKETLTDIPGLFRLVEKEKLKTLFLPASFLKIALKEQRYVRLIPSSVRHIVTAGEQVIVYETARRFLQQKKVYLHNHYGPSETHVVTTLTMEPAGEIPERPPIGRPVSNTTIYILDKGMHLVPRGVAGELMIAGVQVGKGYLNNPELTAEKFDRHLPGNNRSYRSYKSYILYHTGDLARWLPDKNIEFLGRIDQQIKIRGFRIEPGELETQLLNHPGIKDALVTAREHEKGDRYLCAYLVFQQEFPISELREYLSKHLPDYMIPSYFVQLEKIPLTPNRKVDRRSLPAPEPELGTEYAPPGNEIEKQLANIWSEILNIKKETISIDHNFFELGGQSLKATILAARIHEIFNVEVPLGEIFKTPTIKGIAQLISVTDWVKNPTIIQNTGENEEIVL